MLHACSDRDHAVVRRALVKDGWTVTDHPLTLKLGKRMVHVDLGAQRNIIGAIRGTEKIAVFAGSSDMTDLYEFGMRMPTATCS